MYINIFSQNIATVLGFLLPVVCLIAVIVCPFNIISVPRFFFYVMPVVHFSFTSMSIIDCCLLFYIIIINVHWFTITYCPQLGQVSHVNPGVGHNCPVCPCTINVRINWFSVITNTFSFSSYYYCHIIIVFLSFSLFSPLLSSIFNCPSLLYFIGDWTILFFFIIIIVLQSLLSFFFGS